MRVDVIAAAVEATKHKRYVPYAVCMTCKKHVYPEQHKIDGHRVACLTSVEMDAVAEQHKAASKADQERTEKFRRI